MASTTRKQRVSIRDVAHASGVSLTTVSLVLNQGDQRISKPTRERVLNAVKRLDYRPNRLAQGLQNRRSRILAILVPHLQHAFADVYFGELISGIYDEASKSGYKIMLEVASPEFVERKSYLELFESCFIDGLLFLGSHDGDTFVHEMADPSRPVLLVNNIIGDLDHVVCDYAAAGRIAAEHLMKLGHRQVAMIHGTLSIQTARDVKEAFAAAWAEQGVDLPASHFEFGHYSEEGGADAIDELLRRCPNLTAVFAGNDKMAIGAMQRLHDLGRNVPDDVSIVGCDDIHQAAFAVPALTTIRTPLYQLGQRCCRQLLGRLRSKEAGGQEIIPVEMVERHSTARAPSSGN